MSHNTTYRFIINHAFPASTSNSTNVSTSPASTSTSVSTKSSKKSAKKPLAKTKKSTSAVKKPKKIKVYQAGNLIKLKCNIKNTMLAEGDILVVNTCDVLGPNVIEAKVVKSRFVGFGSHYAVRKSQVELVEASILGEYNNPSQENMNAVSVLASEQQNDATSDVEKYAGIDEKHKAHFIQLCSNYGIEAKNLNAAEVKKYLVGNNIREITRHFISTIQNETVTIPNSLKNVIAIEHQESIRNYGIVSKNSTRVKDSMAYIESRRKQATAHLDAAQRELAAAANEYRKVQHIITDSQDLMTELDIIQKDKFFTFSEEHSSLNTFSNCVIAFTTKTVIINYQDVAGRDKKFNLGQFLIQYYPASNNIFVLPFKNNAMVNGCGIHPHVNSSGTICWGNAADEYTSAMSLKKPSMAFDLLKSLLHTYGGTPYYGMQLFEQEQRRSSVVTYDEGKLVGDDYLHFIPNHMIPNPIRVANVHHLSFGSGYLGFKVVKHVDTNVKYVILNEQNRLAINVDFWFSDPNTVAMKIRI